MKTLKKKKYMYTFSFEISLEHWTFKVQSWIEFYFTSSINRTFDGDLFGVSGGLFTSFGPYKKANITNDLLGVLPT